MNTEKKGKKNVIVLGFLKFCVLIYRFIKYVIYGLIFPFVILFRALFLPKDIDVEKLKKGANKALEKEKKREAREKKSTNLTEQNFKDESVKVEKKKFGDFINSFLLIISAIPRGIKRKFDNFALIKNARNKKTLWTCL